MAFPDDDLADASTWWLGHIGAPLINTWIRNPLNALAARFRTSSQRLQVYQSSGPQPLTSGADTQITHLTVDGVANGAPEFDQTAGQWTVPPGWGDRYKLSACASVHNGTATSFDLWTVVQANYAFGVHVDAASGGITSLVLPPIEAALSDGWTLWWAIRANGGSGATTASDTSYGVRFRIERVA